MASSWASSWGTSWGVSWGASDAPAEDVRIGGWLPRKYVRKDGSTSDTLDDPAEEPVTLENLPANVPLSPAILAALFAPKDQTPELMAEMAAAKAQLRAIQMRMREEEEIAVALLLMT